MPRINESTVTIGKTSFRVYHNLPMKGQINSFEAAVKNWSLRTHGITAESLCNYINDKDTEHWCVTEATFRKHGGKPSPKNKLGKITTDTTKENEK